MYTIFCMNRLKVGLRPEVPLQLVGLDADLLQQFGLLALHDVHVAGVPRHGFLLRRGPAQRAVLGQHFVQALGALLGHDDGAVRVDALLVVSEQGTVADDGARRQHHLEVVRVQGGGSFQLLVNVHVVGLWVGRDVLLNVFNSLTSTLT